jgi:ketosteroid isomerase-like protein
VTEENVDIVKRALEAYVAGDLDGWWASASPTIRVYPRPEEPGVKEMYEGEEGVYEYLANWYSGWSAYTVEPQSFEARGDWVVVDLLETGTAKQSEIEVAENFAHALRLRDGEIVEWRMYGPMSEAFAAIETLGNSTS